MLKIKLIKKFAYQHKSRIVVLKQKALTLLHKHKKP